MFRTAVLLLGANEGPNLVALEPLAREIAEGVVLEGGTGGAEVHQQLLDRGPVNTGHPGCGTEAVPFHQTGNDPHTFFGRQSVHAANLAHMLDRSRIKRLGKGQNDMQVFLGMPLPQLTQQGLLPVGIHECTLIEIEECFSAIPIASCRNALWIRAMEYIESVKSIGVFKSVFIDGGFTTNKPKPKDIDLVIELPPPSPAILPVLKRLELDPRHVMSKWSVHLFLYWNDDNPPPPSPTWEGPPPAPSNWVDFFQRIKPVDLVRLNLKPSAQKGILHVRL